jgi:hypothetical protein
MKKFVACAPPSIISFFVRGSGVAPGENSAEVGREPPNRIS